LRGLRIFLIGDTFFGALPSLQTLIMMLIQNSPEAIESVFILYRITGDESLRNEAWEMFQSIDKYTKTECGNAALDDITEMPPTKSDSMESFWTAETLKYFYLIFSEPDLVSLDEYVFNTEAHSFKRPKR
jgi:mannosyl-oligosaccharide alpha-1,2-mannosidase